MILEHRNAKSLQHKKLLKLNTCEWAVRGLHGVCKGAPSQGRVIAPLERTVTALGKRREIDGSLHRDTSSEVFSSTCIPREVRRNISSSALRDLCNQLCLRLHCCRHCHLIKEDRQSPSDLHLCPRSITNRYGILFSEGFGTVGCAGKKTWTAQKPASGKKGSEEPPESSLYGKQCPHKPRRRKKLMLFQFSWTPRKKALFEILKFVSITMRSTVRGKARARQSNHSMCFLVLPQRKKDGGCRACALSSGVRGPRRPPGAARTPGDDNLSKQRL